MPSKSAICTWFVADDASSATYFPQVGLSSDAPEAQATYWRCIVVFYASSLVVNPDCQHVFFTNTRVPTIDGIDIAKLFQAWGVEIVTLPITYRLQKNELGSWGNQFYVFDVIDWLAKEAIAETVMILDSDIVWTRGASDLIEAIDTNGALTYRLGADEYPDDAVINGRTRAQMARFLAANGGPAHPAIAYDGGEIYAARQDITERISARARELWPQIASGAADAPLEEAHFLSVLYELEGLAQGTGNRFIRRMWTTFHHHNLHDSDSELVLWHLPAEKKTGFADLYRQIAEAPAEARADPRRLTMLNTRNYAAVMGWPRRKTGKFLRDARLKVREKIGI